MKNGKKGVTRQQHGNKNDNIAVSTTSNVQAPHQYSHTVTFSSAGDPSSDNIQSPPRLVALGHFLTRIAKVFVIQTRPSVFERYHGRA